MSNAKKIVESSASRKKQRRPRSFKPKVDLENLPDAIVDGKLTVPVKTRVAFVRQQSSQTVTNVGFIFSIDEETGSVNVWDEVQGQFWGFNMKQKLPVIKVISLPVPETT